MKLCTLPSLSNSHLRQLISIITIGVFLFTMSDAFASGRKRFNPKRRDVPSENSGAGGKRGCPEDTGIPLTLVAPQTFVGKTASKRPTFAWYISNSRPVIFALYELEPSGQIKSIVPNQEITASKGVNKFALAPTYPELQAGKKYFWQIAIRCPNGSTYERSEFEVVQVSASTNTPAIDILAEAELWYEAFEKALKLSPPGKLGGEAVSLIQDLAQTENSQNAPKRIQERIQDLQAIAAGEL